MIKLRAVVEHEADLQQARSMLKGDEVALRRFIDRYFPRLYRFALSRLRNDHEAAEEVVQDTLTIAARRIETYRGEASLFTWLAQICRRELVRLAKKNQLRRETVILVEDDPTVRAVVETLEGSSQDDPFKNCARDDVIRLVQLSLDCLPDRYSDALEWKYIEGLSTAEISTRLGIGRAATDSLLARARHSFKNGFQEILDSLGTRSSDSWESIRDA